MMEGRGEGGHVLLYDDDEKYSIIIITSSLLVVIHARIVPPRGVGVGE